MKHEANNNNKLTMKGGDTMTNELYYPCRNCPFKNEKVKGGYLVCVVSDDSAEELAPCDIQAHDRIFVDGE